MKADTASVEARAQFIPVDSFDIVVFGATGDLAMRKLIPALFHRWRDGQIPADSRIIAASRSDKSDADYRAEALENFRTLRPGETVNDEDWAEFSALIRYCQVNVLEAGDDWQRLATALAGGEDRICVYYLALSPSLYGDVCRNIAAAGLNRAHARIVLEKPIGHGLASAEAINDAVGNVFDENAIFRIDHYLGKETVQNLLVLRFMNSLFEPIWNANNIDHVQITVAETVGAGARGSYYDKSGALRDMVQNHMLQLLCLVAMEPPLDLGADTVRDEKIKVLRALRPIDADSAADATVRGQYGAGSLSGESLPAYVDELGEASTTETFVAARAFIDNWRWNGTPFYLRTGKRMSGRRSEIMIQFRSVAHSLLPRASLQPNRLIIRLQPDEGMRLMLMTKDPGPGGMRLRYVPLNLSYAEHFEARYPDAYERLLMAVVRGDLALFMRRDEVEAAWRWVDGILDAWAEGTSPIRTYPAGADGPVQAAMLLDRDGREWFDGV